MSALSAIEAGEFDQVAVQPPTHLRLVTVPPRADRLPGTGRPAGVSRGPAGAERAVPRQPAQAPVRLTRRGRVVVMALVVLLATLAITVVSMSFSGAQAANHGRPDGGYAGMQRIVVQPGQTLWSIAARAEPSADPRQVVAQIMAANSMSSSALQAGQLLWVPK